MGRLDKINEQLKREISFIVQRDMEDPRFQFVSITHVDVSKDLRHAKIHYSVLGDFKAAESAYAAFQSAKGHIRKLLGKNMPLKFIPELNFVFDDSILNSAKIEETIREINEDDE